MEFQHIPIVYIKPDPNQPRKFFDEQAMAELTASVKEKSVIQPIIVRGESPNYMLVCGERRLRASTAVMEEDPTRNTIPAIVRQLSDEEALDLQIIENLQRKDVHPMEEAVAFQSMLEHGMADKDIAGKLGKSVYFVRQRVQLCSLIDAWQKAFFANRISTAEVLKIIHFSEEIQTKLWERKDHLEEIRFDRWDLTSYSGNLNDAPFDLAAKHLKPGPCFNCTMNSATANLFPESALSPICHKISCYNSKFDQHFEHELSAALQDPATIFVSSWNNATSDDKKLVERITKAGFVVYYNSDYTELDEPEKPEYNDFKSDWEDDENDPDEFAAAWAKEMAEYNDHFYEYQENIDSGRYKKMFKISGSGKGTFIYAKLQKKAKGKDASSNAGTAAADPAVDIKSEIERLTTKEKRSKELDETKVWENLRRHFNPHANASVLKGQLSTLENDAAAMAIYMKLGYEYRDAFDKLFKGKKGVYNGTTDEQLRQMIRFFFLDVIPPAKLYGINGKEYKMSMAIAADYFPSVLKEHQEAQQKIAAKRMARVDEKIAALKQQLKELKKPAAAAKKSPQDKKLAKGIKDLLQDSPAAEGTDADQAPAAPTGTIKAAVKKAFKKQETQPQS